MSALDYEWDRAARHTPEPPTSDGPGWADLADTDCDGEVHDGHGCACDPYEQGADV